MTTNRPSGLASTLEVVERVEGRADSTLELVENMEIRV